MVGVGGGKPEENERLNRQRKGRKQIQNILKTGTSKRARGGRRQLRNICFREKEGVIGEKWEREVEEGNHKDNSVSFLCREGNEPEIQKRLSI